MDTFTPPELTDPEPVPTRVVRGEGPSRLRVIATSFAVAGLLLSSATALWMTASTFDLLPDRPTSPTFLNEASGQTGASVAVIDRLKKTPVAELRSLSFPDPGDAADVFTLKTDRGTGYLDQGTGAVLAWSDLGVWQRISETIYMLHTGQGLWWLGLLLGLSALSVPVLGLSGGAVWWSQRRAHAPIAANVSARDADTVILVGSEGGSTWGFARTLHTALTANGHKVHTAPMDSLKRSYPSARRMFLLTATYGDGAAPATAAAFLKRLGEIYEAKGDKTKAIESYTRFVDLWKDADPPLQPAVREVKDRLAKLTGEAK